MAKRIENKNHKIEYTGKGKAIYNEIFKLRGKPKNAKTKVGHSKAPNKHRPTPEIQKASNAPVFKPSQKVQDLMTGKGTFVPSRRYSAPRSNVPRLIINELTTLHRPSAPKPIKAPQGGGSPRHRIVDPSVKQFELAITDKLSDNPIINPIKDAFEYGFGKVTDYLDMLSDIEPKDRRGKLPLNTNPRIEHKRAIQEAEEAAEEAYLATPDGRVETEIESLLSGNGNTAYYNNVSTKFEMYMRAISGTSSFSVEYSYEFINAFNKWLEKAISTKEEVNPDTGEKETMATYSAKAGPPPTLKLTNGKELKLTKDEWAFLAKYDNEINKYVNGEYEKAMKDTSKGRTRMAGTDEEAVDSFLDVLRYNLKHGTALRRSRMGLLEKNGLKKIILDDPLYKYLRDYVYHPLIDGDLGVFFFNQLINIGENIDIFGVGVRALLASRAVLGGDPKNDFGKNANIFWYDDTKEGRATQRKLMELGAGDLLTLKKGEQKRMGVDTKAIEKKIKKAGLWEEYKKLRSGYKDFVSKQSATSLDYLKDAYTDPTKNYYLDTGNVVADIMGEVALDPTLVIGGLAKAGATGGARLASGTAARAALRNIPTISERLNGVGTDTLNKILTRFERDNMPAIFKRDSDLLKTNVDALSKRLEKEGIFGPEDAIDTDLVKSFQNGLTSRIYNNWDSLDYKILRSIKRVDKLLDKADMTLLKTSLAGVFVPRGIYKGTKKTYTKLINNILEDTKNPSVIRKLVEKTQYGRFASFVRTRHIGGLSNKNISELYEEALKQPSDITNAIDNEIDIKLKRYISEFDTLINDITNQTIDLSSYKGVLNAKIIEMSGGEAKNIRQFKNYLSGLMLRNLYRKDGRFSFAQETLARHLDKLEDMEAWLVKRDKVKLVEELSKAKTVEDISKLAETIRFSTHSKVLPKTLKDLIVKRLKEIEKGVPTETTDRIIREFERNNDVTLNHSNPITPEFEVFEGRLNISKKLPDSLSNSVKEFSELTAKDAVFSELNTFISGHSSTGLSSLELERRINKVLSQINTTPAVRNNLTKTKIDKLEELKSALHKLHEDEINKALEEGRVLTQIKLDSLAEFDMYFKDPKFRRVIDYLKNPNTPLGRIIEDIRTKKIDINDEAYQNDAELYGIIGDLANALDVIEAFQVFRAGISVSGLPDHIAYTVLDTVFGFTKMNPKYAIDGTYSTPDEFVQAVEKNLAGMFGEFRTSLDGARRQLLELSPELLGKYGDELDENPELANRIVQMALGGHINPVNDVKVQMLYTILKDPEAIRDFNFKSKERPVVFLDIETTGISVHRSEVLSIALKEWKELPENAKLSEILDAIEDNNTEQFFRRGFDEEQLNSLDIEDEVLRLFCKEDKTVISDSRESLLECFGRSYSKEALNGERVFEDEVELFQYFNQVYFPKVSSRNIPSFVVHNTNGFDIDFLISSMVRLNKAHNVNPKEIPRVGYPLGIKDTGLLSKYSQNTLSRLRGLEKDASLNMFEKQIIKDHFVNMSRQLTNVTDSYKFLEPGFLENCFLRMERELFGFRSVSQATFKRPGYTMEPMTVSEKVQAEVFRPREVSKEHHDIVNDFLEVRDSLVDEIRRLEDELEELEIREFEDVDNTVYLPDGQPMREDLYNEVIREFRITDLEYYEALLQRYDYFLSLKNLNRKHKKLLSKFRRLEKKSGKNSRFRLKTFGDELLLMDSLSDGHSHLPFYPIRERLADIPLVEEGYDSIVRRTDEFYTGVRFSERAYESLDTQIKEFEETLFAPADYEVIKHSVDADGKAVEQVVDKNCSVGAVLKKMKYWKYNGKGQFSRNKSKVYYTVRSAGTGEAFQLPRWENIGGPKPYFEIKNLKFLDNMKQRLKELERKALFNKAQYAFITEGKSSAEAKELIKTLAKGGSVKEIKKRILTNEVKTLMEGNANLNKIKRAVFADLAPYPMEDSALDRVIAEFRDHYNWAISKRRELLEQYPWLADGIPAQPLTDLKKVLLTKQLQELQAKQDELRVLDNKYYDLISSGEAYLDPTARSLARYLKAESAKDSLMTKLGRPESNWFRDALYEAFEDAPARSDLTNIDMSITLKDLRRDLVDADNIVRRAKNRIESVVVVDPYKIPDAPISAKQNNIIRALNKRDIESGYVHYPTYSTYVVHDPKQTARWFDVPTSGVDYSALHSLQNFSKKFKKTADTNIKKQAKSFLEEAVGYEALVATVKQLQSVLLKNLPSPPDYVKYLKVSENIVDLYILADELSKLLYANFDFRTISRANFLTGKQVTYFRKVFKRNIYANIPSEMNYLDKLHTKNYDLGVEYAGDVARVQARNATLETPYASVSRFREVDLTTQKLHRSNENLIGLYEAIKAGTKEGGRGFVDSFRAMLDLLIKDRCKIASHAELIRLINCSEDDFLAELLFTAGFRKIISAEGSPEYMELYNRFLERLNKFDKTYFSSKPTDDGKFRIIQLTRKPVISHKSDYRGEMQTVYSFEGSGKAFEAPPKRSRIVFTDINEVLKKVSHSPEMEDYLKTIHACLVKGYDNVAMLTDGASLGTVGMLHRYINERKIAESFTGDIKADSLGPDFTTDEWLWHYHSFDNSVIGEYDHRWKFAFDYEDFDLVHNLFKVTDEISGRTRGFEALVDFAFNPNSHCQIKNFLKDFSPEEVFEGLKANDGMVVIALKKSKSNTRGYEVVEYTLNSVEDVRYASRNGMSVVSYDTFLELQRILNDGRIKSPILKAWTMLIMLMKIGQLANIGTWTRNLIDATIKNAGAEGSLAMALGYELEAAQRLLNFRKIMQQITGDNITEYAYKLANFERYMSYADFQHLRQFTLADAISGGESARTRKMVKQWATTRKKNRALNVWGYNTIGDDLTRWEQLNPSDVRKSVEEYYVNPETEKFDDMPMERYMEIWKAKNAGLELNLSTAEQYYYGRISQQVIDMRVNKITDADISKHYVFEKITGKLLAPMSHIEQVVRYSQLLALEDLGYSLSAAHKEIVKTHFNYDNKPMRLKLAECVFPYATFQFNNILYWLRQVDENPRMLRYIEDTLGELSFSDIDDVYSDEDGYVNQSRLYQINSGGIPIGSGGMYFKLSPSYLDALNWFYGGPEAVFNKVVPALRLTGRAFMQWAGFDSFPILSDTEYSTTPDQWTKDILNALPVAGTLNMRYYSHFFDTQSWKRLDNPTQRTLVKFMPSLFGAVKSYDRDPEETFESFQKELEKNGQWYDSERGKVVDISEKNTKGLNNPALSFKDRQLLELIAHGRLYDKNVGRFVDLADYTKGGLNRDWDFSKEGEWEEYCRLKKKYFGVVYDYNTRSFVPKDKVSRGGLNDDNLDWDSLCDLNRDLHGLYYDGNQGMFVAKRYLTTGGLNSKNMTFSELCAYQLAIHGKVWDNANKKFVKVQDPSVRALYDGKYTDWRAFDQLGFNPAWVAKSNTLVYKDGIVQTLDGTYVLSNNAASNERIFDYIKRNFSYTPYGRSTRRWNYKSGWASGYRYNARAVVPYKEAKYRGNLNVENRSFSTPYTSTRDYSGIKMALTGERQYEEYYKFEYNYNYSYSHPSNYSRMHNTVNSVHRGSNKFYDYGNYYYGKYGHNKMLWYTR